MYTVKIESGQIGYNLPKSKFRSKSSKSGLKSGLEYYKYCITVLYTVLLYQ